MVGLAKAGVLIAALAGCAALPLTREARYAGAVTPDGACGVAGHGTLSVSGAKFAFAPSDGVILLHGEVAADGTLAGSLSLPGADHKPFVVTLAARLDGDRVSGAYQTPRCRFAVVLTRA